MDIEIDALKSTIKMRDKKKINYKGLKTKKNEIIEYNFFSNNNIENCNLIKKIDNYSYFFAVIDEYEKLKISENDEYFYEGINLLSIKYDIYENNYFFYDFLKNLSKPKLFIYHLFNSYTNTLNALNILNKNNLYFINFDSSNIIFDNNLHSKIINFESCLNENTDNIKNVIKIIENCNNYSLMPIETHFLFYIIKNDIDYVNCDFISEIVNNYIKNMSFLHLFSLNYKNNHKEECITFLSNYINKPKNYILQDIYRYRNNWMNYSLSIIYLYLIGNIIKNFNIKETILNKLLLLLNKNIHPDPRKRENIEETLKKFNLLSLQHNNWNFIKDNEDWNLKFKNLLSIL